jgi:hypothetical protein
MSEIYRIILRHICSRIVIQGPWHESNITEYYKIMSDASKREFYEDNYPTLKGFLEDCNESAFEKSWRTK